MTISDIGFDPANDPDNAGSEGAAIGSTLAENSDVVGPVELRGISLSDAENKYVGNRRAEAINSDFSSGTKNQRANKIYNQLLNLDRITRIAFEEPAVGMQTLVTDPKKAGIALDKNVLGPIEQAQLMVDGVKSGIRRTRERLASSGNSFVYFGVRDMDSEGLSHWHIYWCLDRAQVDGDSLDLFAGVESYISHAPGATEQDHPATEAVLWDQYPEQTVETYGKDQSQGGAVHPSARYVASSLPHLGTLGEMDSTGIRHGTVEWAIRSKSFKRRNQCSLPADIKQLRTDDLSY